MLVGLGLFIYIVVLNLWLIYLKKVLAYKSNINSLWLNYRSFYIVNNSITFQDHLDSQSKSMKANFKEIL